MGLWHRERKEQEETTSLDGDYMDYWITWIETDISFLIHVIL
jgi:hypothetical protein